MNYTQNQFVKLPNNTSSTTLAPRDILVYCYIKQYMNDETLQAYPELSTIQKDSGITKPTILKAINNLEKEGYISVIRRDGTSNVYNFNNEKKFEKISFEFLHSKDLTFKEKAVIAASQQYMFKDVEDYGKISYSDRELAKLLNISQPTLSAVNKSLVGKNYLTLLKEDKKDLETGLAIDTKVYHMSKMHQAIIWSIDQINERQDNTEKEVQELREIVESQGKLLEQVLEENKRLRKERQFHNEYKM